MSDYPITYRGVPVPESVLVPVLVGPGRLEAFKLGVDAALDTFGPTPEPIRFTAEPEPWSYFTDEEDPSVPDAYFRRIRGTDVSTSEFMAAYQTSWESSTQDREWLEAHYRPISEDDLPESVRQASGLPFDRYFTQDRGVIWRMPPTGLGLLQTRNGLSGWEESACRLSDFFQDGDVKGFLLNGYREIRGTLPDWVRD